MTVIHKWWCFRNLPFASQEICFAFLPRTDLLANSPTCIPVQAVGHCLASCPECIRLAQELRAIVFFVTMEEKWICEGLKEDREGAIDDQRGGSEGGSDHLCLKLLSAEISSFQKHWSSWQPPNRWIRFLPSHTQCQLAPAAPRASPFRRLKGDTRLQSSD